jgi:hypothetical protein
VKVKRPSHEVNRTNVATGEMKLGRHRASAKQPERCPRVESQSTATGKIGYTARSGSVRLLLPVSYHSPLSRVPSRPHLVAVSNVRQTSNTTSLAVSGLAFHTLSVNALGARTNSASMHLTGLKTAPADQRDACRIGHRTTMGR